MSLNHHVPDDKLTLQMHSRNLIYICPPAECFLFKMLLSVTSYSLYNLGLRRKIITGGEENECGFHAVNQSQGQPAGLQNLHQNDALLASHPGPDRTCQTTKIYRMISNGAVQQGPY